MKLQKKISNTLFALLLCDLPCEGQQSNVYADCIGSCIAQAVNPALIMQNENVSQKIFDVGNFYVLTLGGESEKQLLSACWQCPYFGTEFKENVSISSKIQKLSQGVCQNKIDAIQKPNDNGSYVFKTDSNDRAEPVQKHFYELNVSFKEIDDFKIGLHILLFLLIAYVAKKTYNLISR